MWAKQDSSVSTPHGKLWYQANPRGNEKRQGNKQRLACLSVMRRKTAVFRGRCAGFPCSTSHLYSLLYIAIHPNILQLIQLLLKGNKVLTGCFFFFFFLANLFYSWSVTKSWYGKTYTMIITFFFFFFLNNSNLISRFTHKSWTYVDTLVLILPTVVF